MRAAENQRVDAFVTQRREVVGGNFARHGAPPPDVAVFHQRDEQRAGDRGHGGMRVRSGDLLCKRAARDRRARADHADLFVLRCGERGVYRRIHHAEERNRKFAFDVVQHDRADRAAGGEDHVRALPEQKPDVLPCVAGQDLAGAGAVGHAPRVAEVNEIARGQQGVQLLVGGQPAESAVKNTDHSVKPFFVVWSCARRGSARQGRKAARIRACAPRQAPPRPFPGRTRIQRERRRRQQDFARSL